MHRQLLVLLFAIVMAGTAAVTADAGTFLDQDFGREEPDIGRGDPVACCKAFLAEMKDPNP